MVVLFAAGTVGPPSSRNSPSVLAPTPPLPLVFERNDGQTAAEYAAIVRTPRLDAAFRSDGVVLAVKAPNDVSARHVTLALRNAATVTPVGEAPLAGRMNYLRGSDARAWTTNVPTFARLRYPRVYSGVDLVFHGTEHQLEYDFEVAPRASTAAIALTFGGADDVRVNAAGDLIVSARGRDITQPRPVAYQQRDGRRAPVPVAYVVHEDHAVTFAVGDYDREAPLTIDPMIVMTRLFGGNDFDDAHRVVWRGGSVYVAGRMCSPDFPTHAALQPARKGLCDAYVAKMNGDGTSLVYATYLGGSSTDYAMGLDVDASGAAYVSGLTSSKDFPTTAGAWDRVCGSDGTCLDNDGFAAKLSNSGASLVYSTYLGGSSSDLLYAIAVNAAGEAVVPGESASPDFPTTAGAPHRTLNGQRDAIVTKLSASGASLVYSTYLGGGGYTEAALGAAFDSAGNAWIVGETDSPDFPVLGAFQPSFGNTFDPQIGDGFVVKLTASGSVALSSFFGGDSFDSLFGVATDASGVYIAGRTNSTRVPGQAADRNVSAKSSAAVVAQIAADGSHVVKTQLLDGNNADNALNLAISRATGAPVVHVVGWTNSSDFPVTSGAWEKKVSAVFLDVFYATLPLDSGGALAPPTFATYLGMSDQTFPAISTDGADGMLIASSASAGAPLVNAPTRFGGGTDGVLVHIVPPSRWTDSTPGEVHLYAADAHVVGAEWSLVADPSAADGRRAANVDRAAPKVAVPLSAPASYVEFGFNADAGAYRLWIRGMAAGNSYNNDSAYAQFSDSVDAAGNPIWRSDTTSATPVILEDCTGCGVHGWGWNDNGYGTSVLGTLVRFRTGGHHVLRVQAREDGLSIDQVVLSKAQFTASAPGATKDDTTVLKRTVVVTPPPPPPPPGDNCTVGEVVLHAAGAQRTTGWNATTDPTAAGGARLFNPDAGAPKAAAPSPGLASFELEFNADAGVEYSLWVRGKAQNDFWGNDSVFVQFSDAVDQASHRIWAIGSASATSVNLEDCSGCGEKAWGWQDNGYGAAVMGQNVRFSGAGTHTIKVITREDGFSIDQIVLSSGTYVNKSPGALINDTTILPACASPPLR